MSVSSGPSNVVSCPASALAIKQAARSGSATTSRGASLPWRARICTETAAARPPTPPGTKTCVGGFSSASAASSATSR
jgi:hypothetical protein